jgi:hypothetical protein
MKSRVTGAAHVARLILIVGCITVAGPAMALGDGLTNRPDLQNSIPLFELPRSTSQHKLQLLPLVQMVEHEPTRYVLAFSSEADGAREPLQNEPVAEDGNGQAENSNVPELALIPRVGTVRHELPSYWYSAIAGGAAGLVAKAVGAGLGFIPGVLTLAFFTSPAGPGPAVFAAMAVGMLLTGLVVDSAVSALASSLVFDLSSSYYESNYLASFAGHLAGNAFALGVPALGIGFGAMLITGTTVLADFAVAGTVESMVVFSVLLGPPSIVVSLLTWLVVPSLIGAWAVVNNATPAEGFVLDPEWKPLRTNLKTTVPHLAGYKKSETATYFSMGMSFPGS